MIHSVQRKPERFTVEGENCVAILVVHHMLFVVDSSSPSSLAIIIKPRYYSYVILRIIIDIRIIT